MRGLASVEAKESEKFPLRRWGQRGHLFRIGPRAVPPPHHHLSTSPDKQAMLYCSAESWRCMRQQRWSGATSGPPLNESGMLWKGSTTDGNGVLLWGGFDTNGILHEDGVRGTGLYRQSQLDGRWASSINTAFTVLFHCLSTVWCLGFKPERLQ